MAYFFLIVIIANLNSLPISIERKMDSRQKGISRIFAERTLSPKKEAEKTTTSVLLVTESLSERREKKGEVASECRFEFDCHGKWLTLR